MDEIQVVELMRTLTNGAVYYIVDRPYIAKNTPRKHGWLYRMPRYCRLMDLPGVQESLGCAISPCG